MKRDESMNKHYDVLQCLSWLPRKMLSLHGQDNMTEFVLHELSNKDCFNFHRAAFFIDNPDFNCIKGVAGWSKDECALSCNIWQNPAEFSRVMSSSPFNQTVRGLTQNSLKNQTSDQLIAEQIAKNLNMKSFGYCSLGMKHDNHGLLIFEPEKNVQEVEPDHVLTGLSLLGFCAVH